MHFDFHIVTEVAFDSTPTSLNLKMRVTAVPLPFPYQFTNEAMTHKVIWVCILLRAENQVLFTSLLCFR